VVLGRKSGLLFADWTDSLFRTRFQFKIANRSASNVDLGGFRFPIVIATQECFITTGLGTECLGEACLMACARDQHRRPRPGIRSGFVGPGDNSRKRAELVRQSRTRQEYQSQPSPAVTKQNPR
jgi:hypothetical protein